MKEKLPSIPTHNWSWVESGHTIDGPSEILQRLSDHLQFCSIWYGARFQPSTVSPFYQSGRPTGISPSNSNLALRRMACSVDLIPGHITGGKAPCRDSGKIWYEYMSSRKVSLPKWGEVPVAIFENFSHTSQRLEIHAREQKKWRWMVLLTARKSS